MEVRYTSDAYTALVEIINYIEPKNTKGAEMRWFKKYEHYIITSLQLQTISE